MYSKKEFMENAGAIVKKMLPAEMADKMTIDTVNIVKVNDQELNGLVFKRDDAAAAPTIYVDHLYEQYKEGEDIRAIAGELTQCYLDSLIESPEVIQPDMSYENIKDNLTLRLVELKRNRMYLVNVPYMTVGNGLALVCDIRVNSGEEGFWRTTVNKEMMAENNYDKKQMFTAALADAEKIEPPVMVDMAGKLFGANGHTNVLTDAAAITPEDKSDMYILSNQSGVLGASALFYPGIQESIAEKLGESYYALPSSLEIIIAPESAGIDKMRLGEMVKTANQNVVDEKDVLSDNVFRYDKDEKQLSTAVHQLDLGSKEATARC